MLLAARSAAGAALFYKHANRAYLETAVAMGLIGAAEPIVLQLYVEPCSASASRREGHGAVVPPEKDRARIATYFDPLPFWYAPFEEARLDPIISAARDHAAPDADVPFLALAERLAAPDPWAEPPVHAPGGDGGGLGLADDDWVWVESHAGRIKAQIKLMDGVNPDTVWTWNAIGKRSGAWNLAADSPEFTRGFLLNHLITEMLPQPDADGHATRQCRPGHRPGRLVRFAGAGREGDSRRGGPQRPEFRDIAPPAVIGGAARYSALRGGDRRPRRRHSQQRRAP
jgi:sulfite dehydrogenase (quinone) subunit SoeA